MTLKYERQYQADGAPEAKLVIRDDGAVVVTPDMEPFVEDAIDIILDEEKAAYEEDPNIDARLYRDDLGDINVVEELDADPGREIDLDNREIWQ